MSRASCRPRGRRSAACPTAAEASRFDGTGSRHAPLLLHKSIQGVMEATMMKGGLLWLIGIPIPIILILFFLGYLH